MKTIGNRIGQLGAGTMGHAAAMEFAIHGYNVTMVDATDEALKRGLSLIDRDLTTMIEGGVAKEDKDAIMARVHPTTDYADLAGVDYIAECVFENLQVKQESWEKAEAVVDDDTILATNTSGLSPSAIAKNLKHPERFVVAHYWNPVQLMPLVEVVPGENTSQETVDVTVDLMNSLGKHAVPLKVESLGFVGNRLQMAVIREENEIVRRGIATPEAVDDIMKYSLGRRWSIVGPLEGIDQGGLDVFDNISKYLYDDLANNTGEDPALKEKVEQGNLGAKTGQGFYDWSGDKATEAIRARDRILMEDLARDQRETEK